MKLKKEEKGKEVEDGSSGWQQKEKRKQIRK